MIAAEAYRKLSSSRRVKTIPPGAIQIVRVFRGVRVFMLSLMIGIFTQSWNPFYIGILLGFLVVIPRPGSPLDVQVSRVTRVLSTILFIFFLLAFFSIHFIGFHIVHAMFLNKIFPLPGLTELWEAIINNSALSFSRIFDVFLHPYGIFLFSVFISERNKFIEPLAEAISTSQEQNVLPDKKVTSILLEPYINVVKNHLLIFFFAFIKYAGIVHTFPVFTVAYVIYYLPSLTTKK